MPGIFLWSWLPNIPFRVSVYQSLMVWSQYKPVLPDRPRYNPYNHVDECNLRWCNSHPYRVTGRNWFSETISSGQCSFSRETRDRNLPIYPKESVLILHWLQLFYPFDWITLLRTRYPANSDYREFWLFSWEWKSYFFWGWESAWLTEKSHTQYYHHVFFHFLNYFFLFRVWVPLNIPL